MKHYCGPVAVILLAFAVLSEVQAQTNLAQALGATNLVWTTGGNNIWVAQTNTTFDSYGAAESGTITHNQTAWLQTTVVGPGTVSFWWKTSSCTNEDFLIFYLIDSTSTNLMDYIAGTLNWNFRTFDVPPGTNTLRWSYEKDPLFNCFSDHGWVDQVIYRTNPPISLETALDACGYTWAYSPITTNGSTWIGQTNVTHDGVDAAESGALFGTGSSPNESWMQTTVSGATNVSFWWKVSSLTNLAVLEFYVGATKKTNISGEVNWRSNSFAISGTQTLKWRYVKSNAVAGNSDRGWVDEVIIRPPAVSPTITNQPQGRAVFAGSNVTFSVGASGTTPFSYQWRFNGNDIADATASAYTLTDAQATNEGNYSVMVANGCGGTVSSNAVLTLIPPPVLEIQSSGGSVALSWPVTYGGFDLRSLGDLTASNWSVVTAARVTNGGTISVNLPITNASTFYRLQQN